MAVLYEALHHKAYLLLEKGTRKKAQEHVGAQSGNGVCMCASYAHLSSSAPISCRMAALRSFRALAFAARLATRLSLAALALASSAS